MKRITTIGLAVLGATALLAVAPAAQAQDWHHDYHGHYDHRDWHHGDDWRGGAYVYAAPPPVYYAPPPAYYVPPPVVYGAPGVSFGINIR